MINMFFKIEQPVFLRRFRLTGFPACEINACPWQCAASSFGIKGS